AAPTAQARLQRPVNRRYGFESYQPLPNGHVGSGGFSDRGGDGEWTADARPHEAVQTLLERYLRDELGVTAPITHRWAASVGYSRGVLPVFARLRGGVVAIGGYSGTGNVVGAVLAREAVAAAVGDDEGLSGLFDLVELG